MDYDQIPSEAMDAIRQMMETVEEFKDRYNKRMDRLEVAFKRLPGDSTDYFEETPTTEKKAFESFLRYGESGVPEAERKALVVGTDTAGGYLAPVEYDREIVKNLILISPVRQAARVGQMTGSSIILPRRTGAPAGYWVAEQSQRTASQETYGQIELPSHEQAVYVPLSTKLIEDSAFAMQEEISSDLADVFGQMEGAAFISGDGIGKPTGILTSPYVTSKNSGSATSIADANGQANGIISLYYDLALPYRARSTWLMNGTTLATVRTLKDSQDRYIWQPSLAAGQPETILGRPVIECPDMPDPAAGTYPIVIGDIASGYRIYDRTGMSILRDPYTQATSGLVLFHARRRVAGDVVKGEALRKLKCSA